MNERKYQMTRLRRGDYLLPSNDRRTLWRIYAYEEDGSLERSDGTKVLGTFWACARRPMPQPGALIDVDEFLYTFGFWAGPFLTRRDAIDEALRVSDSEGGQ